MQGCLFFYATHTKAENSGRRIKMTGTKMNLPGFHIVSMSTSVLCGFGPHGIHQTEHVALFPLVRRNCHDDLPTWQNLAHATVVSVLLLLDRHYVEAFVVPGESFRRFLYCGVVVISTASRCDIYQEVQVF